MYSVSINIYNLHIFQDAFDDEKNGAKQKGNRGDYFSDLLLQYNKTSWFNLRRNDQP